MTLSENSCKNKEMWQIVDNEMFKTIEDARDQRQRYLNVGIEPYIESIGKGFKLVLMNCLGQQQTLTNISIFRKSIKGMKRKLEIISIE